MRALHLAAVVSSLAVIACGGGGGNPDASPPAIDAPPAPDADGLPRISASFTVRSAGGGPVVCQQGDPRRGTDAVVLYARPTGQPGGGTADVFDCDASLGTSGVLPGGPGSYDVWLEYVSDRNAVDPSGWVMVGTTPVTTLDVQGTTPYDATLDLDAGFFEAAWAIKNGASTLTCAQVAAQNGVSVLGTLSSTSAAYEDLYTCEDGNSAATPVITYPDPLGDYVFVVSLLDAGGAAIGASAAIDSSLADGNQYQDLGTVDIDLF